MAHGLLRTMRQVTKANGCVCKSSMPSSSMSNCGRSLEFDQGTLVLRGCSLREFRDLSFSSDWKWNHRIGCARADAIRYWQLSSAIQSGQLGIEEDQVKRWQKIAWSANRLPVLRTQQVQAIEALQHESFRGVVVMPTGTGKTMVALETMCRLAVSTLIVSPIRDLMYQWHRRVMEGLGYDAGIIGDNIFNVRPVSVTTYDSAAIHMPQLGNQFGLLIFDECHHLPGDFFRDAALMSASPYRIGLSATPFRSDGRHVLLDELIGKRCFELKLREVAGDTLAGYRIVRVNVQLSTSEQHRYIQLSNSIRQCVAERRQEEPNFKWQQLCRETNLDRTARAVMRTYRQKVAIENRADEKLRVLEDLFKLHMGEPVLVFTGSNAMAREISLRFLIPCLLSHCGKKERQEILTGFENGTFPAIVANQILDEGVDLPDTKVAIVLGGSSSVRQAKQRLGRVLRKSPRGNAVLYEVVLAQTGDVKRSRNRRRSDAYRNNLE